MLTRRAFVQALSVVSVSAAACTRPAKTPLSHLRGEQWVAGVYELHAQRYLDVQMGAETSSHGVYRVLAQKGVSALGGLQAREVPFFVRVSPATNAFEIDRTIPERLTFSAEMTEQDRLTATAAWNKAREHIHTDYFEIHRLNWSLTTLLQQLVRIHSAMEQAEIEEFKIVRELGELRGGAPTPYQLPERVTRDDYDSVLLLLLARLEDDRRRLGVIEASIAAVGLCARSTDAGSGSLSANIHQVMLSVIHDADATTPVSPKFPQVDTTRRERLALGKQLAAGIEASPEYLAWKKHEETAALEQIGVLFTAIDAVTHLPTSALFHAVIDIWRGEGDYLTYLEALANIVPGGGELSKTVTQGIETTRRVRGVVRKARAAGSRERIQAEVLGEARALLNTSTEFGRARVGKQLAFFADQTELSQVREKIAATELLTAPMPEIPGLRPAAK